MEYWDLYDANKNKIDGIYGIRDQKQIIPDGMFHITVWLYIVTKDGEIFLTQRAPTKSRSYLWEPSGGSVLKGECSVEACVRELREETSIEIEPDKIKYFDEERGKDWILEYYYTIVDYIDVESLVLQESEVMAAKLVTKEELQMMNSRQELVGGVVQGFEKVFSEIIS